MSKLVKGISIITSVTFAGLVIAGTAAAAGVAFPIEVERITRIITGEGEAFKLQAEDLLRKNLGPLGDLVGRSFNGGGDDGPKGWGGLGGSAAGSGGAAPKVFRAPPSTQTTPPRPDPLGFRWAQPYSGGGQVAAAPTGGIYSMGPGGGTTTTGVNTPKSPDPDPPAVTPIPGAVWLLGSSLAGLLTAKRYRDKKSRNHG